VNYFNSDCIPLWYIGYVGWFEFVLEKLGYFMFEKGPEVSETLEWMLQSRQVGDETLVKTLIHEHYADLHHFALSIIQAEEQIQAGQFAEQVIFTAVEKAQEYRQDYPVKVWLFRLAYKLSSSAKKNQRLDSIFVSSDSRQRSRTLEAEKLINAIPENSRQAFLLVHSDKLTAQQTAYVLDIQEDQVKKSLNLVGYKWLEWLGGTPDSPAPEYRIRALFSKLWPLKTLSEEEEHRITQTILAHLAKKGRRKHRLVIIGELFLLVAALAVVAGMGRLINELTPESTPQVVYQTHLVNQVILITPTPAPTIPATPFPFSAILYRAEGGETLNDIADRIFLNVTILEALNHIPADQPLDVGQKIMIGVSEPQLLMPTLERNVEQQTTQIKIPEPLSMDSSREQVFERVVDNRDYWRTLWADALVIQYGPPGYVGPPDIRRQQIWINQPYFNFLVDGNNGGEVEHIYTSIGGLVNLINRQTGEEILSTDSAQINYLPELQQMLLPSEKGEVSVVDINILGQESVAGRDALIIDWFSVIDSPQSGEVGSRIHQGRYWVDTSLGLILRMQTFNGDDLLQLFQEVIVAEIEFDVPVPNRLFDRDQVSQTYFAEDFKGNHDNRAVPLPNSVLFHQPSRESIEHRSTPTDFDVDNSRLTFQWTSLAKFDSVPGDRVDLFGDGYYLDNIRFTPPNQLICTRSANGELLAATGWSDELPYGFTSLIWFDLNNLPLVEEPLPGIVPYDFVFSPDNQQLAVYGCQREGEVQCGIYLVELLTGKTTNLLNVEQGSGLLWAPDSSAIAIQGSLLRQGKWRVLVFDTETGNVIHDGPFDWEGFWVAPDSPIHDWGVPYPQVRGGLEVCSNPPQGD
jgi:DNA-directed RNA polymerase specialized sigma24 family protein